MTDVKIDTEVFYQRLKLLYTSWESKQVDVWGGADAFAIATPPPAGEDLRYLKSSALQIWLLGYEFPETITVFLKDAVHFVCGQKKASHLESVRKLCKEKTGKDMVLHGKAKSEDGTAQMTAVLTAVREACGKGGAALKFGRLVKEPIEGSLMQKWMGCLDGEGFAAVDVTNALSDVFAVKDESEVTHVKKASFLSAQVVKSFVVPKLEDLIDEEKKITHAELMDATEAVITEPSKIKVKLKQENCDICFPPIFQSGGKYDLRASAASNEEQLTYEATSVIICAVGARYASYCSNVARSYLIDATSEQERAYKTLLKAQEAALAALRPGKKVADVYKAVVATVEKEAPDLVPHLTKTAGAGIGIEFREQGLAINAKNERVIKPNMTFNVAVGLQGLKNSAAKKPRLEAYALLLADTVVVREEKVDVATGSCSKAYTDVAYSFKDEDEEDEAEAAKEAKVKVESAAGSGDSRVLRTHLRSEDQEATKEEKRRQHQAELARQKIEETARRLAAGGLDAVPAEGAKRSLGEAVAYRHIDDVPVTQKELMIQVDQKQEAILLPIYGLLVPFHVSMVKNVSSQADGGQIFIRIIFNVPGGGFSASDLPVQKFADAVYLKEVSFRSRDSRHANTVVQQIKTMSKQVKQRESERAERATLVTQEKLQLAKGRAPRLPDLWIRPPFGGKGRKLTGALEAHANGFRYSTAKADERVDIMYNNIRHAFFQPAENEMITLLHFHLHNPIMVGKKKTKDLQFFVEVMENVQTVGGSRRSAYDPDEIEEEQRERERRNKINSEFKLFTRKVQDAWDRDFARLDLEFDIPFRELGFHGVPFKSSAFIVPTVHCLVELIEFPFLVLTLNDMEIVNLERVGLGQKTFDIAIVFKDFRREVQRIEAIPSTSLDSVKEWLDKINIKYYESRLNLNWKPILANIMKDPEGFLADGGWEFLNLEGSDSEEAGSEESQAYEPSDVDDASESEEDAEDDESVVDSEDEDEEEEEEEEEEEGLTWDELEEKARREDKEVGSESDSEDERRRRKQKGGGGRPMAGRGGGGGSSSGRMSGGPSPGMRRPGGVGGGTSPGMRRPGGPSGGGGSSQGGRRPTGPPPKRSKY